jgi:hypothetical protein
MLEDVKKRKVEVGLKHGWFVHEYEVFCPHCGTEQYDGYEHAPEEYDSWGETQCESCSKSFKVKKETLYSTEK